MPNTLVVPAELFAELSGPSLRVVDCRFSLADEALGQVAYANGHIPGSSYAHLNRDLSGPIVPGKSGRHPLPDTSDFCDFLERSGISNESRVVAYDDAGGAMAARLWWLLRWVGHDAVRVLDGGFSAWSSAAYPITTDQAELARARFEVRPRPELVADIEAVDASRSRPDMRLFDARAPERFRGDEEPIDRVPGHIPGARSLPFAGNLEGGRFLPRAELRMRFENALGGVAPENVIVYCGSGVTACHHVLAAEHAGLSGLRLYAGSYSEWIADGTRAVETGSLPASTA